MAKNDLNKNRIEGERKEAAYMAQWNELFNREAKVTNVIAGAAWDDSETCQCGKNIKYCKYPNCASGSIMRLITFALVAALLLIPTAASAQDWCDIHPDSPECGDLTEPVIPIIGPPCSSDFEWSCKEFNLFLPAIGV